VEAYTHDYKTPFLHNGHKWTTQLAETLFLTIDHFCKFVNSFITRTKIFKRDDVDDLDLSQNPFWVKMIDQTLYDSKNNTKLNESVLPFIKNVSHYESHSYYYRMKRNDNFIQFIALFPTLAEHP